MPLRDDLLQPIEGDNPSGVNLQYDVKVFDVLKEARLEDDESIPSGKWERAVKKSDRNLIIKLAGDSLAKRSKDLRLAGWYLESLVRKEGFAELAAGLEIFQKLQEEFWDTFYPEKDPDDGSLDLRIGAIEGAAAIIAVQLKLIPLTKTGLNYLQCQDAQALGFENDPRSDDKKAIRKDAVARGKAVGEDLKAGIEGTPKAFYFDGEKQLQQSLDTLDELDRFHEEKYGDDYPSLTRLKTAVEDVQKVVVEALNEKRKTEPDPIEAPPEPEATEEVPVEEGEAADGSAPSSAAARSGGSLSSSKVPVGLPTNRADAYLQVAAAAEYLRSQDPSSQVPYLLCTALRFGETRSANLEDFNFPVAPATETRQAMRKLASETKWDELMKLCIRTMPEPCGRVWLDLQRYVWRAAQGLGNNGLAATVVSTVRTLLTDFPTIRMLTLSDDTSAANPETQQWIDAEVLKK